MQITLSIGIPAYLNQLGVERIINSLEDRDDIEILISEDVPTPEDVFKDLPNLENIWHWKNTPPLGPVPNWNAILQRATGEFVWVIHHDEVPHFPKGLDAFLRHLQQTPADLLISHLENAPDNFLKRAIRSDTLRRVLLRLPKSILLQNYIGSPSNVIVRRSCLEAFDAELKWFVDLEWYYRLTRTVGTTDLSEFSVTSFPNDQSITSSLKDNITQVSHSEIDYICSKHDISRLFCRIWHMKANLRDLYIRKRARA